MSFLVFFFRPVEQLLNETDVKVVVLSGQLDLIVDTPGDYGTASNI